MKTPYPDTKSKHPKSMVVITILNRGVIVPPQFNDIGFSYAMKHALSRCSNLYGARTVNACSHAATGFRYIYQQYYNIPIINPTPNSPTYVKEVTDIASFVYELNQKTVTELILFINETITNHRKTYGYVDEDWPLQQLIEQYIDGNIYQETDDITDDITEHWSEDEDAKREELDE